MFLLLGVRYSVFTEGKGGHSPQPSKGEAWRQDGQFAASAHHETSSVQAKVWLIMAKEDVISARCRQIATGELESGKGQRLPQIVCV